MELPTKMPGVEVQMHLPDMHCCLFHTSAAQTEKDTDKIPPAHVFSFLSNFPIHVICKLCFALILFFQELKKNEKKKENME
jgi:hypothetical protein